MHGLKEDSTLYVDGPNKVYLMDHCLDYIVLTSAPKSQYYEKYDRNNEVRSLLCMKRQMEHTSSANGLYFFLDFEIYLFRTHLFFLFFIT